MSWNRIPNKDVPTLFSMVRCLIHSWWRGDRIRVSPMDGQLLRLQPPCWLHICNRYAEVVNRRVADGKPAVIYECRTSSGSGTLLVEVGGLACEPAIEWRENGLATRLALQDVEVFSTPT